MTVSLAFAAVIVLAASCDDDGTTGETVRPPDATSEITPIPSDTGGASICPSSTFAFREAELETFLGAPFKSPATNPAACTATDIDAFDKNLRTSTSSTPARDLKKGVGDSCAACLFSRNSGAAWQLIVSLDGQPDTAFIVNFGACHASLASTKQQTCGRTVLYDQLCAKTACKECEPSELESCIQKVRATGGACAGIHEEITTACPDYTKSQPICGTTAAQHARVLCGPVVSPVDAGSDSGDGGDGGDGG